MKISDRVRATGLPLEQLIVIGSGILDQLELRKADDIDLVVTEALFEQLRQNSDYICNEHHGEKSLTRDDVEIWLGWGGKQFKDLVKGALTLNGVLFVAIDFLIRQKKISARPKDIADITLLRNYQASL